MQQQGGKAFFRPLRLCFAHRTAVLVIVLDLVHKQYYCVCLRCIGMAITNYGCMCSTTLYMYSNTSTRISPTTAVVQLYSYLLVVQLYTTAQLLAVLLEYR